MHDASENWICFTHKSNVLGAFLGTIKVTHEYGVDRFWLRWFAIAPVQINNMLRFGLVTVRALSHQDRTTTFNRIMHLKQCIYLQQAFASQRNIRGLTPNVTLAPVTPGV